jgi:ribose/xylose/arabinose/galactoside ABC-type transport system permease subunit
MTSAGVRVEYANRRRLRHRNTRLYRLAHWPIWITVFFLVPGPVTFRLFTAGFDLSIAAWLACVMTATGLAALKGRLPGTEPQPYIIRFTEDKPNPLYRRICYTAAWSELIAYAALNMAGLVFAAFTGRWLMAELYEFGYFPIVVTVWILGAAGVLPRVMRSTRGEGHERRYFYGTVWAAPAAQAFVLLLWKTLPVNTATNWIKLCGFMVVLAIMGSLAVRGVLPRTRRILPGELAISD